MSVMATAASRACAAAAAAATPSTSFVSASGADPATLAAVKEVITRTDAPSPNLPFSAGIKANGFIFTAGQVGADPKTGKVAGPDVASQTRQAIANVRAVLEAGG